VWYSALDDLRTLDFMAMETHELCVGGALAVVVQHRFVSPLQRILCP
jgi:hypothetical protein